MDDMMEDYVALNNKLKIPLGHMHRRQTKDIQNALTISFQEGYQEIPTNIQGT